MHLATDYIHKTPRGGHCRVRIYLSEEERDAPLAICTELAANPGQSVTNAAERIASEVLSFHRLPTPVIWVEHYEKGTRGTQEDPQTFDLVTFSGYEVEGPGRYTDEGRRRVSGPTWKPLDRATVEALVGGPLGEVC